MRRDVSTAEDVQVLGQLPDPDQIAAEFEGVTQRAAAERTLLEAKLEIAKLLNILAEHHQYKSRRLVAFARQHGGLSRTDAYDLTHLAEAADAIVAKHAEATQADPAHPWPTWRQALHDLHDDEDEPAEEGGYWNHAT